MTAGGDSNSWEWEAPLEACLALLESTGSVNPDLLNFTTHVLSNSPMSFAVEALAKLIGVRMGRLGQTIYRACQGLDGLEKARGPWREPAKILGSSANVAALRCVCDARRIRISQLSRRDRLERIQRKLDRADSVARTRAWIDDFLQSPPAGQATGSANR